MDEKRQRHFERSLNRGGNGAMIHMVKGRVALPLARVVVQKFPCPAFANQNKCLIPKIDGMLTALLSKHMLFPGMFTEAASSKVA